MNDREHKDSDWSAWNIDEEVSEASWDDAWSADRRFASEPHFLETMTRIGGEVSRLRAEMDGLLEQNATLMIKLQRLLEVVQERGTLSIDDFELACDVMAAEEAAYEQVQERHRKARH